MYLKPSTCSSFFQFPDLFRMITVPICTDVPHQALHVEDISHNIEQHSLASSLDCSTRDPPDPSPLHSWRWRAGRTQLKLLLRARTLTSHSYGSLEDFHYSRAPCNHQKLEAPLKEQWFCNPRRPGPSQDGQDTVGVWQSAPRHVTVYLQLGMHSWQSSSKVTLVSCSKVTAPTEPEKVFSKQLFDRQWDTSTNTTHLNPLVTPELHHCTTHVAIHREVFQLYSNLRQTCVTTVLYHVQQWSQGWTTTYQLLNEGLGLGL